MPTLLKPSNCTPHQSSSTLHSHIHTLTSLNQYNLHFLTHLRQQCHDIQAFWNQVQQQFVALKKTAGEAEARVEQNRQVLLGLDNSISQLEKGTACQLRQTLAQEEAAIMKLEEEKLELLSRLTNLETESTICQITLGVVWLSLLLSLMLDLSYCETVVLLLLQSLLIKTCACPSFSLHSSEHVKSIVSLSAKIPQAIFTTDLLQIAKTFALLLLMKAGVEMMSVKMWVWLVVSWKLVVPHLMEIGIPISKNQEEGCAFLHDLWRSFKKDISYA